MWLPYRYAFEMAVVLAVFVVLCRSSARPGLRRSTVILQELAIVLTLYGVWQYVRRLAVTKTAGAVDNAYRLWDIQQWMHLPSEVALQRAFIDNRPTMWFLNVYYGAAHVPAAAALLIWVFFWHRDRYAGIRATFALTIAGCIAIQAFVPMAPPRFLTDLGFVDAGLKYGMSVYGTGGNGVSNEVAAMPSLHWAWAFLVGVAVWRIATNGWRWLGPAHVVLTALAVTITANHWWLDGAVAGLVLALAFALQLAVRSAWARAIGGSRALVPAVVDADEEAEGVLERPLSNA